MTPPIARLAFRSTRRAAILWGVVFGSTVLGSARGFAAAYPDAADRKRLAASFGSNAGVRGLLGVPHRIDTVAGFTAWRSLGVLAVVTGVWGLLASTRVLRGEEDARRWELVLAGPVTRRSATRHALAGLAASLVATALVTAAIAIAGGEGIGPGPYVFLAVAIVSVAALFMAVGAFASQLAATRRQAAVMAGGAFGVFYVLRLIADSASSAGWLRWATPLGWVEELRPMTASRPVLLLPLAGLVTALSLAAVEIAGRRDEGRGVLPSHDSAHARPRLLTGPAGLATRLSRGTAAAWVIGSGAAAFVFGLVSKSAAEATTSTGASDVFARLGARRLGAEAYLGVTFLVLGAVVALAAAGIAAAWRDEEATGRVDNLLVRPLDRARWLAARLAVGVGEVVAVAVVVGCAGWLGTVAEGAGVSFGRALGAGLNLVPAAVFVLGAGTLLLGVAPRAVAIGAYGVVGWSFLIELVASLLAAPSWFLDLSLFHHVALAPSVDPNAASGAALILLGAVAAVAGVLAFGRRDVIAA